MIDPKLREIVKAFQAGSREAFAKLVGRYQNLVTSVAFANTGDLQRSEDIAQQAFLVAWQNQEELRDPDRFGGWIRGIANNLARNDRRLKSNTRNSSADVSADVASSVETPESLSSRREQNEMLWATLDRIPLEYREPLILFYREEHSVVAVAEQMGLSESAVKQRLKRGRAMVKQEIENMVEQFLFDSRPTPAFSASVMAALPVVGSKVGSAALKTGAAIGAKATAGKLTTGLSAGAIGGGLGVLGGLFGLFAGIGGAWLGTKQGIKHATSEEERQLHMQTFVQSVVLSVVYCVGTLVVLFGLRGGWMAAGLVTLNVLFFVFLMWIIFRFSAIQRSLHQKYGKPEIYQRNGKSGVNQPVSLGGLRANSLCMMLGVWAWLVILTILFQSFAVLAVALAVVAIQIVWFWMDAANQTDQISQVRFNARICLVTGISQFLIVIGGCLLGANNFDKTYDNVPIWACGCLALAISSFVGIMLLRRASKMEAMELKSKK